MVARRPPRPKPGRRIQPPDETGTVTAAQMLTAAGMDPWQHGMEADRSRTDRVFLTSARDMARAYAGAWALSGRGPHGTLYQAAPAPDAEPDPDFEEDFPGLCVQAPYASVLAVAERRITIDLAAFRLVMLKYTTWQAGVCPDCGHDSALPDPGCPCTGCVCGALQVDPTAARRVYAPEGGRPVSGGIEGELYGGADLARVFWGASLSRSRVPVRPGPGPRPGVVRRLVDDPGHDHPLRYGAPHYRRGHDYRNYRAHDLIVGEIIVRPHVVIATSALTGMGLAA